MRAPGAAAASGWSRTTPIVVEGAEDEDLGHELPDLTGGQVDDGHDERVEQVRPGVVRIWAEDRLSPTSGPQSMVSFQAGVRASGNASTATTRPTRMQARKWSKSIIFAGSSPAWSRHRSDDHDRRPRGGGRRGRRVGRRRGRGGGGRRGVVVVVVVGVVVVGVVVVGVVVVGVVVVGVVVVGVVVVGVVVVGVVVVGVVAVGVVVVVIGVVAVGVVTDGVSAGVGGAAAAAGVPASAGGRTVGLVVTDVRPAGGAVTAGAGGAVTAGVGGAVTAGVGGGGVALWPSGSWRRGSS